MAFDSNAFSLGAFSVNAFDFAGVGATAVVSGAFIGGGAETLVVAGAQQTVITLTGDTWNAAGSAFDDEILALLAEITSAQSETLGWNNEVRDEEVVGAVTRTSDTVVTIIWSAAPLYDITISESITVTIPASILVSSALAIIATPKLTIIEGGIGIAGVRGRKPLTRKISGRSIAIALDGIEQPYPVYRFSRRDFVEKSKHNPFAGL